MFAPYSLCVHGSFWAAAVSAVSVCSIHSVSCHRRVYIPCIYVLNKIDQISIEELDIIYKVPHCVPISAHHRWNFDDLLEKIWDYLRLVRM